MSAPPQSASTGLFSVSTGAECFTLVGRAISVSIAHNVAQVKVESEYLNESGKDHSAVSFHPVPPSWALRSVAVYYQKKEAVTNYTTKQMSSMMSGTLVSGDFTVPWTVVVGTNLFVVATYLVVFETQPHLKKNLSFTIPGDFFPSVTRPKETTVAYNQLYTVPVKRRTADGLVLTVNATANVPLRGGVSLFVGERDEKVEGAEVSYSGDSSFLLQYRTPFDRAPVGRPLRVVAAVLDTEEPLRLFVVSDKGQDLPASHRHAVTLCLTPAVSRCEPNAELLFLIDSHDVQSSKAFAQAIFMALHGVPPSTRVNLLVLREEGDLCVFPEGGRPATAVDPAQLAAVVSGLVPQAAGKGVSRLLGGLTSAVTQTAPCGAIFAGYVRHVVLLTDETDIPNVSPLVALAAQGSVTSRVHAVGLEFLPSVQPALLEVMVEKGNGLYRRAGGLEEIPGALVQLLATAIVPTLTNIRVAFYEEGVRCGFLPDTLPVLPQGSQQYLSALAPSSIAGKVSAYATGKVGQQVVEFIGAYELSTQPEQSQCEILFGQSEESSMLHAAAALQRIRALTDHARGHFAGNEELATLSMALSVPSPHTQLVLRRDGADEQKVNLEYHEAGILYTTEVQRRHAARVVQSSLFRGHRTPPPAPLPLLAAKTETPVEFLRALVTDVVETVLAPPSPARLVPLQRRDGSFLVSALYSAAIGVAEGKVRVACPEALSPEEWATVVALAYMRGLPLPLTALAILAAERYVTEEKYAAHGNTAKQFLEMNECLPRQ